MPSCRVLLIAFARTEVLGCLLFSIQEASKFESYRYNLRYPQKGQLEYNKFAVSLFKHITYSCYKFTTSKFFKCNSYRIKSRCLCYNNNLEIITTDTRKSYDTRTSTN
jgi:hypothetical protein